MPTINALEVLAGQHDEIDALLDEVAAATSSSIRTTALDDLANKLSLHLAVEQELLYPAADPWISTDVRAELSAEHQEIKRILADLIWLEHEDQRFARKLVSLRTLLAWHEAWQEAELFERIADGLPAPQLAELGAELHVWIDRTTMATAA